MAKKSCPDVGQLAKDSMFVIPTPAAGVVGIFQLGAVKDAVQPFLFPASKGMCGPGRLQLVACSEEDRDLLAAAADGDQLGISVKYLEDDGATEIDTCARSSTAANGEGLCHASWPVALHSQPAYGLVEIEIVVPAGLAEIAIAWTPDC